MLLIVKTITRWTCQTGLSETADFQISCSVVRVPAEWCWIEHFSHEASDLWSYFGAPFRLGSNRVCFTLEKYHKVDILLPKGQQKSPPNSVKACFYFQNGPKLDKLQVYPRQVLKLRLEASETDFTFEAISQQICASWSLDDVATTRRAGCKLANMLAIVGHNISLSFFLFSLSTVPFTPPGILFSELCIISFNKGLLKRAKKTKLSVYTPTEEG